MNRLTIILLLSTFSVETLCSQLIIPNKEISVITAHEKNGALYCGNYKIIESDYRDKSLTNKRYLGYWFIRNNFTNSQDSMSFDNETYTEVWILINKLIQNHPESTKIEDRDDSSVWKTNQNVRDTLIGFVVKLFQLKEIIQRNSCSYIVKKEYINENNDIPVELLSNYNEKVDLHNSIKNACTKPNIEGFTTHPDAVAYAECWAKNVSEHNRNLRELKELDSILALFYPELEAKGLSSEIKPFEYTRIRK